MEDIILKKGDIVKLENGERFSINGWAGTSLKDCKEITEVKRPVKYETIYKAPLEILDKEEKEYLSAVIKPFRNNVTYVKKCVSTIGEWIYINANNDFISFPSFKPNTMYKGMKANKEYTLEELGL